MSSSESRNNSNILHTTDVRMHRRQTILVQMWLKIWILDIMSIMCAHNHLSNNVWIIAVICSIYSLKPTNYCKYKFFPLISKRIWSFNHCKNKKKNLNIKISKNVSISVQYSLQQINKCHINSVSWAKPITLQVAWTDQMQLIRNLTQIKTVIILPIPFLASQYDCLLMVLTWAFSPFVSFLIVFPSNIKNYIHLKWS